MTMKILILLFSLFCISCLASNRRLLKDQTLNFTLWNNVLNKYISKGTLDSIDVNIVDYNGIRNDIDFMDFLHQIQISNTSDFTREEFYAFYVNVYNAFAVKMIIDNACKQDIFGNCGPIASIRDIGTLIHSVWDAPAGVVGGKTFSLDDIEDSLREPPNGWVPEITLHASIVCASISCPDLINTAYGYPNINDTFHQMNQSMRAFLNNQKKGMSVNEVKNTVTLSHIFSWFGTDFTNQTKTLLNFLVQYADPNNQYYPYFVHMNQTNPKGVNFNFFSYDWNLNAEKNSKLCGAKSRPCFPLWALFIAIGCIIITIASIIIVLYNRRRNVLHY